MVTHFKFRSASSGHLQYISIYDVKLREWWQAVQRRATFCSVRWAGACGGFGLARAPRAGRGSGWPGKRAPLSSSSRGTKLITNLTLRPARDVSHRHSTIAFATKALGASRWPDDHCHSYYRRDRTGYFRPGASRLSPSLA